MREKPVSASGSVSGSSEEDLGSENGDGAVLVGEKSAETVASDIEAFLKLQACSTVRLVPIVGESGMFFFFL